MPEQSVPEPTELVYLPGPSWAPAFAALGLALLVVGIFAKGFIVAGWVYSVIGVVILLAALRRMVSTAARDFMRLPRRQRPRSAVLPAGSIRRSPTS